MSKPDPRDWTVIARRQRLDARPWLQVWAEDVRLPDGRVVEDFYRVEVPDYVIVLALTSDGNAVVERQYKHGLGQVGLNLPAGYVEPGEPPLDAAQRELSEETGFAADEWRPLGSFVVDGNRGCGRAHIFLAHSARRVREPHSDDLEETEVVLIPIAELAHAALDGGIPLLPMAAAVGLAMLAAPAIQAGKS